MDTWMPWTCVHGTHEHFDVCSACEWLRENRATDERFSRELRNIESSLSSETVEESLTAIKGLVRRMEAIPGYRDYEILTAYAGACSLRADLMGKHRAKVLAEAVKLLNTFKPFDERLAEFNKAAEGLLPIVPEDACYAFYRQHLRIMDAADFPDLLARYTRDKKINIPDSEEFRMRLESARAVVIAQALAAGMELSTDPNDWTAGPLPTPYEQAKWFLRCQKAIAANAHVWT